MKECRTNLYRDNTVVTHGPLMCFGGFGQPRCKFLYICAKENKMRFKEKCDSCGEKRYCETVHIDKDEEQRWCKKCRDEEENAFKKPKEEEYNEGLEGFPQEHI